MVFVQKSNFFHLDFFGVINSDKNAFFSIFLTDFYRLDRLLKSAKNDIFLRAQSMVFVQKSDFFSSGFFGMIKSEKIFFHILDRKERVLDPKSNVLRADVSKYRPEVYKSEKSKTLKKIHKVALGKLLT